MHRSGGYQGKKKKPEPSRQSGGTSGDLSIPDYVPETPTVPYGGPVPKGTGFASEDVISSDPHRAQLLKAARERQQAPVSSMDLIDSIIGELDLSPEEAAVVPFAVQAHTEYPDIPISLLMSLTRQESGFDPNAVSSAGAEGLTQFMPETAPGYGVQYGDTPEAMQSQVTGAANLLSSNDFADNPKGALEVYTGGEEGAGYSDEMYNDPVLEGTQDYAALDKLGQNKKLLHAALDKSGGVPNNDPLSFEGGPQDVRTAIDVVPKHKLFKWLQGAGGNTGNRENIANLNPVFARHLIRAAAKSGDPLTITSGQRSTEEQGEISPGTNPAASPGYSVHQFGGAADTEPTPEQIKLLEDEGIEHGYAGGETDPPHTEFTDPRLIKRMTNFGPVRSGYAPPGLEEAVGDLTDWEGDGVSSGGAVAPTSSGSSSLSSYGYAPSSSSPSPSSSLMTAALENTGPENPTTIPRQNNLDTIMDMLDDPVPSVSDPTQMLKRKNDSLLRLALQGRV